MKNNQLALVAIAVVVGAVLIIGGAKPAPKFDPATFQLASGQVQFLEFYSKI